MSNQGSGKVLSIFFRGFGIEALIIRIRLWAVGTCKRKLSGPAHGALNEAPMANGLGLGMHNSIRPLVLYVRVQLIRRSGGWKVYG